MKFLNFFRKIRNFMTGSNSALDIRGGKFNELQAILFKNQPSDELLEKLIGQLNNTNSQNASLENVAIPASSIRTLAESLKQLFGELDAIDALSDNEHVTEIFPNAQAPDSDEPEDISIVVPVYNHEATLREALESVLMQEMPYTSLIYCFNDASTDNSAEILSEYAKKYPDRIKVYTSPENLGSGKKSLLYHRPHIKGRYWCLLEGDDYWTTSDKIAKQIAFLDSHPDYVGCSCNTVMKNEVTGEESIIKPDRDSWNLLDLILLKRTYAFYVHTSSLVWRNIYLDQGFFLPPSFQKQYAFGDVVLMHTMLGKGGKVQNLPVIMSCYRVTGRGIWSRLSAEEQAAMNLRVTKSVSRSISIKYKMFVSLQELRGHSNDIDGLIPRPVNE